VHKKLSFQALEKIGIQFSKVWNKPQAATQLRSKVWNRLRQGIGFFSKVWT
jgi:hypothetical protein